MERRYEVKFDEITKKVDQPWQVVCTEIKSIKESITQLQTQQGHLIVIMTRGNSKSATATHC